MSKKKPPVKQYGFGYPAQPLRKASRSGRLSIMWTDDKDNSQEHFSWPMTWGDFLNIVERFKRGELNS